MTRTSYSNFTAASRTAGTATVTATISGGANPSGRTYSWAGGGSSNQYSIAAPTANTSVVLTVTDGASTVTGTVTVQPSPSISDATVVEMVLGKAVSLGDFAAHLGQSGNSAFFTARLQSLTGVTAAQAQTLLSDGALYKAHAMSRAQIAPDLAPVSAPTAWETMAPLFAEDCGDLGCACDQLGDCGLCPPECGGGSAPPPDPVPGLAVVGVAWWPEIDPQSGQAWGVVDAVLQNPYGLNILSATVSATANLSGGGLPIASNTVTANYPDHAIAEASTQNPPTQTTVYTTSGSYTLEQLSLIDLNGNPETGDQETWTVSPVSATWTLDATPTISLVTVVPSPLPAGSQGLLTVYGNNLGTGPALSFVCEAGNSCFGNLTVVTSSYTPQPPTTAGYITATIQASSNAAGIFDAQVVSNGSGGFGFQAGGTQNSPTSAPKGPIPVLVTAAVAMIFRCSPVVTSCGPSDGTDITSTSQDSNTQVVVVGQGMVLSANVELPPNITVVSQSWSVPGSTVGGYNTTVTPTGPIAANFGSASTAFYWFNIGNAASTTYAVSYSATLSNNQVVTANSVFQVEGPTNPQVVPNMGAPALITKQNSSGYYLALGPPAGSGYGITFTPGITQPVDFNGNFVWAQVIDSLFVNWLPSNASSPTSCTTTTALDNEFPYAAKSSTNPGTAIDTPNMLLLQTGLSGESYTMSSHMYLMWQPNLPSGVPTIPVPLGSVQWSWFGDASVGGTNASNWTLGTDGYARPNPPVFSTSASFPMWNSVFLPATSCPTVTQTFQ